MMNKKITASFELVLIVVSVFSFAYILHDVSGNFDTLEISSKDKNVKGLGVGSKILEFIIRKFTEPMIPAVSAAGPGCCRTADDTGEQCLTTSPENCAEGALFAEGAICSETNFCQKGCCFNEDAGIFYNNVLEEACSEESWVPDPNCNMPAAKRGCCILGSYTKYGTFGECKLDTETRALGVNSTVDWRGDLGEGQCIISGLIQEEGACVFSNGECTFGNSGDCLDSSGLFAEGVLCTAESLNTICEPTRNTICVEGKDGVYFKDSCGNYANIYDSSRVDDNSYWDRVIEPGNLCGDSSREGNANSENCGNCNRHLGGRCSPAGDDDFDVTLGDNYCKSTSCERDDVAYRNGESWCEYDGKMGEGDDVVGSLHWQYVCNYGKIDGRSCGDYRNGICIQHNTLNPDNDEILFRNGACVTNNWRECISLNYEEDERDRERCADTLNCRVHTVEVGGDFKFDICTPKYPAGFDFYSENVQKGAEQVCSTATQNCTVVRSVNFVGKCKTRANAKCVEDIFVEEMNNLCKSLGDCGLSANIAGELGDDSYEIEVDDDQLGIPEINSVYISQLKRLANPVPGQFAEVEDYTKFLEAAGLFGTSGDAPQIGDTKFPTSDFTKSAIGLAGIGYAAGVIGIYTVKLSIGTALALGSGAGGSTPIVGGAAGLGGAGGSLAAFSGVAIGAAVGMIIGIIVAKAVGASPLGTLLLTIGGALLGAMAGAALIGYTSIFLGTFMIPFLGWGIAALGAILMIIGALLGSQDCDNIEVSFECKPWQPQIGGEDCEVCNEDSTKPCTRYRCESLGSACRFINVGTEDQACAHQNPGDSSAPVISLNDDVTLSGTKSTPTSEGHTLSNEGGGCLATNNFVTLGITTDELTQCRFSPEPTEFEEMDDFGPNSYLLNHTVSFLLPDPSHGRSMGIDWNGEMKFYIKCRDFNGNIAPGNIAPIGNKFYVIDMCVNQGPDSTPPIILATDPIPETRVSFDATSQDVTIVTNELSTCRWDVLDKDYSSMANEMTCNDELFKPSAPLGYVCSDEFYINGDFNEYYIRCKDQPWLDDDPSRSVNSESFVFVLNRPSSKISVDSIGPNTDFKSPTEFTTVEILIETRGGGEWHSCSYSLSGFDNLIKLFETGTERTHRQSLNLPAGEKHIYVECEDETGDFDRAENRFRITYDTSTPQIARVWQNGNKLNVVTTEDAECRYTTESCRYNWEDGTTISGFESHIIDVLRGSTYYIKCQDEFGNTPTACSITVRAV
jgi:hypothetical protein